MASEIKPQWPPHQTRHPISSVRVQIPKSMMVTNLIFQALSRARTPRNSLLILSMWIHFSLARSRPTQDYTGDTYGFWHISDCAGHDNCRLLWAFLLISENFHQSRIAVAYAVIGNDLKELQKTSWIATSYLLTLTSFQYVVFPDQAKASISDANERPLYGKLSDIFGRKNCLLFSYAVFAIGCMLCGSAKNMNQLIFSRAFQGIGGGGMQTYVYSAFSLLG